MFEPLLEQGFFCAAREQHTGSDSGFTFLREQPVVRHVRISLVVDDVSATGSVLPPKGMASVGVEPTTFALLARRSNRLS